MHILHDTKATSMLGTNQHQEPPGESRMDKMRKFLSSPLTRKKPVVHSKTFGTPLDALLQRTTSHHSVPFIITRLCQYIQKTGLTHEGLFRVSGNARSVERLRASFDRSGDAPLETEGDVPSAAALLKLFLRELPDPIIPLNMHCQYLDAVKDKDKSESISCLADLVDKLPPTNYCILSYLSGFLRQVSNMEDHNRMSASSLGIVFGPNLFRVTEDFVGLKEQSLTNQIVTYFITDYENIFKRDAIYLEDIDISSSIGSSSHQVPVMVSSWPEAKGCTTMLSSWSLGPLTVQTPDDNFLPLCPITYTVEPSDVNEVTFSVQDEKDFACQSNSGEKTSISDFTSHLTETRSYESSMSSSLSYNVENQDATQDQESFSNKYEIAEETMLSLSFNEFAITEPNDSFSFMNRVSNISYEDDYGTKVTISKDFCDDVEEVRLSIPERMSEESSLDSESMLQDSHKSYPRGRRRHVKYKKSQESVRPERRSRSELRSNTFVNEDECNGNASFLTHSSKNEPLYGSTGTLEDSNNELRHSWPAFKKCREEEDIALSPLPQQLEMSQSTEASVSPSAFRSYLSHRNLHLDPNLPPSPPVEQEDLVTCSSSNVENSASSAKQLTRKVHALKKKIKLFEENFEKLYGYKPSSAEKCSNIAVKKMLAELNKAKQELKQAKQEPLFFKDSDTVLNKNSIGTNTLCSQGLFSSSSGGAGIMSIEESVKEALNYLVRHRKEAERPETLEEMTKEQLISEKVLVQKVLLNFESMHGRPSSKVHRELVRPLYDRYRCTKRLISRLSASKDAAELQPILEHETMNFPVPEQAKENFDKQVEMQDEIMNPHSSQIPDKPKSTSAKHINFHELSYTELNEELDNVKEEKRKLRKILKDFEEQFKKENRRKAQREDKRCMETYYTDYKNAKSKLKLLEALVAKHEQTSYK